MKRFNINTPREHGVDAVESIEAMHEKQSKSVCGTWREFRFQQLPIVNLREKSVQNCDFKRFKLAQN